MPKAYQVGNGAAFLPIGDRLDVAGDTMLVWMAGLGEQSLFGVDCDASWLAVLRNGVPSDYFPPPAGGLGERIVADVCHAAPLTMRRRLEMRLGWLIPQFGPSEQENRLARLRAARQRLRALRAESGVTDSQSAMMDSLIVGSAMARDTLTRSARVE